MDVYIHMSYRYGKYGVTYRWRIQNFQGMPFVGMHVFLDGKTIEFPAGSTHLLYNAELSAWNVLKQIQIPDVVTTEYFEELAKEYKSKRWSKDVDESHIIVARSLEADGVHCPKCGEKLTSSPYKPGTSFCINYAFKCGYEIKHAY